jgi:peptidoglycan hydrolase-like protein with peptidoglycan-binding domain
VRNLASGTSARAAVANEFEFPDPRRFPLGWSLLRRCARRPADCGGLLLAGAATLTIIVNALYFQKGPHPAPIIKPDFNRISAFETTGSLVAVPRPRPPELSADPAPKEAEANARPRTQLIADIQAELGKRGFYDAAIDGVYGPKMDAAIRDFEQAAGLKSYGEPTEALLRAVVRSTVKAPERPSRPAVTAVAAPRPPASIGNGVPSSRVAAAQRALADFGYGPLKPTGVFDDSTKAAIEKFERERKLPVTGQLSGRVTRELAAVTGRPLE